jgi:hypothetical protein
MKKIFQLIILIIPITVNAQNIGFTQRFSNANNKIVVEMIELINKDLVVVCKENVSNTSTQFQSKFYFLSENGRLKDSLVFSDSVRSIQVLRIVPTQYGYCLLGEMKENGEAYFWYAKLNAQFQLLNEAFTPTNAKNISFINYTITKDMGIAVVFFISFVNYGCSNALKIDNQGVLTYYNRTLAALNISTQVFERRDSSGYMFLNYFEWIMTDSLFNVEHRKNLDIRRLATPDVNPTGLKKNDSTYYYAGRWTNYNGRRTRDLVFLVLNSIGEIKAFKTVEAMGDTNNVEAQRESIDTTKDGRFIYWGGTNHYDFLRINYSPFRSYFILTKLNSSYQNEWQKRYGGDAYYSMQGVLATSDGGCAMYGLRYDYNTVPKTDAIIIKVDGNGIVTSETSIPIAQPNIIPYPNPSNGQLNFKKEDPSVSSRFDLNLYDMSGKIVFQKRETDLSETFDLSHLSEGNYMYQIKKQEQIISVGKWIKNK